MSILKLTGRSIRSFLGRYMALFLIVALSVGFFAGLKLTKNAMVNTLDSFAATQKMYDFRIFSTLGFGEDDLKHLSELPGVASAEGMQSVDALLDYQGVSAAYTLFSLPDTVNLPFLAAGRMPEREGEVLADDRAFDETDIGAVLSVAAENDDAVNGLLAADR